MKTYQELMEEIQSILNEGVYDKGVLKAFILAGGPGSGKSYVTNKVTSGLNLKLINSDDAFERGLKRAEMTLDVGGMDEDEFERAMEIRDRAKDVTKLKQELAVEGRIGLVIDGTGKDFDKIRRQMGKLQSVGYDTYMIFVNTSLEVALQRNQMRDRKVPEEIVKDSWNQVQNNIGKFQNLFGNSNMIIVDNNNATENVLTKVWKRISKIVDAPVENHIGRKWIEQQLQMKDRRR